MRTTDTGHTKFSKLRDIANNHQASRPDCVRSRQDRFHESGIVGKASACNACCLCVSVKPAIPPRHASNVVATILPPVVGGTVTNINKSRYKSQKLT